MNWTIEQTSLGRILVAPAPEGRALFYTTRDFPGALTAESTADLRKILEDRFDIESSLATCEQVHGSDAVRVHDGAQPWCEHGSCDALFTERRGVALGIKVADCLPVTILDSLHHVIANVHAGWRVSVKKIVPETIERLRAETSFDPATATAFLGPSIRSCCFEVGSEVVDEFAAAFPSSSRHVIPRLPRPHLDLVSLTTELLVSSGVPASSVFDSGVCTRCEGSLFHSYRRDGTGSGRNLAVAAQ